MKKKVYIILGPTASGKTAVAIELAKKLNGEIVSADSMQIYKGMDIGTAKPSIKERQGIPHHLFDIAEPDEAYSVAMFQQAAKACIEDIIIRGKVPIVAGGTGLYLNALTYDLDFTETSQDSAFREELMQKDALILHDMLSKQDAQAAMRIHPHDKKRIVRRLEILKNEGGAKDYVFRRPNEAYQFIMAGLTTDRAVLYERINRRVDGMVEQGLVEEVKALAQTYTNASTSMQAIGYKELLCYLQGNDTLDDAVEKIKRNSRRYAKRQWIWFKRDDRIVWYDTAAYENNAAAIAQAIIHQQ
ncbi:tRNA dimethylallyltransferase [Christensenellaceae bacterium]|nr:tRNA dimethylallyltransferase [Christensenellaceae bacterium]BDF61003.1 tRNA dimethylallyltransferase [Christensenellaceae bacterium]